MQKAACAVDGEAHAELRLENARDVLAAERADAVLGPRSGAPRRMSVHRELVSA